METGYELQVKDVNLNAHNAMVLLQSNFKGIRMSLNYNTWLIFSGVISDDKKVAEAKKAYLEENGIVGVTIQEIYC